MNEYLLILWQYVHGTNQAERINCNEMLTVFISSWYPFFVGF